MAETFFRSLSKLQHREQARAIEFVTRFQRNPANPGQSLERLNGTSKEVWSGRISQELRAILHQQREDWAILHAGHHDAAYKWAERRQIGKHPVTGILQVVERVEVAEPQLAAPQPEPAES